MNRQLWLAMIVLAALAHSPVLAANDGNPVALRDRYTTDMIGVGDWLVELGGLQWVAAGGTVTGLAFGPGRAELAYTTTGDTAGSALWLLSLPPFDENGLWIQGPVETPARLLWRAPQGRTLSGPLWPAPNASGIALLARSDDAADLLSVSYVSGAITTLARSAEVIDLAWAPDARHVAYTTESDGARDVWLQTLPPGEPRRIGTGGLNLRWSLDGALTWLRPDSETTRSRQLWDPQSDRVKTIGSSPARTASALWSPDGLLCAALEPTGDAGENQLVIYPSSSTVGDSIVLPGAHPQRLLSWSPDSRMVALLLAGDQMLLAGARPPGSQLLHVLTAEHGVGVVTVAEDSSGSRRLDTVPPEQVESPFERELKTRASLLAYPLIDPRAGLPAWSSAGDLLAYVLAGEDIYRHAFGRTWPNAPYGHLVVQTVERRYVEPRPLTNNIEAQQVLSNVKNVALCLQMYLADNNDVFPPVGDTDALLPILDPYFKTSDIFMRPGTEDDLVVHYVVPPGLRLVDVEDPSSTPVAIVDYSPDFFAIGFSDGHADLLERTDENAAALDDWWAEFDALRADDPDAMPPPFPPEQ